MNYNVFENKMFFLSGFSPVFNGFFFGCSAQSIDFSLRRGGSGGAARDRAVDSGAGWLNTTMAAAGRSNVS